MSEEKIIIPVSFSIIDSNTTNKTIVKTVVDITPFVKAAVDQTMDTMMRVIIDMKK